MLATLYEITLIAIFGVAAAAFIILCFVSAPYGRHQRQGWGPTVPARFAWMVMESPAVLVIAIYGVVAVQRGQPQLSVPFLFLLFWEIHYIYRTFAFPVLMPGGSKRFPIVLVFFAMVFNSANGFVNGYSLFLSDRVYPSGYLTSLRFVIGASLFITGLVIHFESDRILRKMRRKSPEYTIPRGWLFDFVSAPNYFGEIIQWIGWAVMTWSVAGLSFAVFTIANLLPRGLSHHRWYASQFQDYPEKRRAVVPFLF